ncbi:MAG: Arc family DNA-binding protein [Ktedonobacteraceae bacterium]
MENKEKRFSVRFPLDVLETIKQVAKEDGRSINSEIIWIVREYITKGKAKKHA